MMKLTNKPRHRYLSMTLLLLLAACADPASNNANNKTPDLGADLNTFDMSPDLDMAPDQDMSAVDPCAQVSCGEGGRCMVVNTAPTCACPEGFVADGQRCITAPSAPSLDNLPAEENGAVGQPDSFQVMASDPNNDALTFALSGVCPFAVNVDSAGKLAWTCPATSAACDVTVSVTDEGGLSDTETLSIACVNGLPAFSSTAPITASEGQELRYVIVCADPYGAPVTLSVAPDDTCGGVLTSDTYSFTPNETRGGTTCLLRVLCADAEAAEAQSSMVAIAEVNDAPAITNLPASTTAQSGQPGSFMVTATDADLPAQPLIFSATTTCSFPVTADAVTGLFSFVCGAPETCDATLSASDGQDSALGSLSITCANGAPAINTTAPTAASEGALYTYTLTCSDPDGDALTITLETATSCPGATLTQGAPGQATVSFTPDETRGGTICALGLRCSDDLFNTDQISAIIIAEVNDAPALTSLPASTTALWGRAGSFTATAADSDLPAQALTFSLVSTTCSFPVAISAAGAASFTCANTVESCTATMRVSDGAANADATLAIDCQNNAPMVSDVSISPNPIPQTSDPLTCTYTFSDPDGDQDNSTIEWLVAGVSVATGPTFSNYLPGDSIACRVTPNDAALNGTPITSSILIAPDMLTVSAGNSHTCTIKNGALFCWGLNASGQLGDGTTTNRTAPVQVVGLTSNVSVVSAGNQHTCAIHNDALKCWGTGNNLLGDGITITSPVPIQVTGMTSSVSTVSAGAGHTCAIQNGALKCWGNNSNGRLGDGTITNRSTPVQVTGMTSNVSTVSAGTGHTCAIQNGALKCWGNNNNGQLGDGTKTEWRNPAQVSGMASNVTSISVGTYHTCAVKSGALKCWGNNVGGQLGDGTTVERTTPTQVNGMTANATTVSAGIYHTCAIHSGALKCWGNNAIGQLGDGTATITNTTPVQVVGMTADISSLSAGYTHTCAIHSGAVKCWGHNASGQLAAPGQTSSSPVAVSGISSPTTIIAGQRHTCSIQNSALFCWGHNYYGQLGDGTTIDRTTPVQVTGFTSNISDVSAGEQHTCALQNGSLFCWGDNRYGQLGDGTTTNRTTPVQVTGMSSDVSSFSAGYTHTCAIQNGALKCWGNNANRLLGDGTTINRTTPVQVVSMTSQASSVSAGEQHTCALQNYILKCWGDNRYGQVGDGTTTNRSTPVQVTGMASDVSSFSAGYNHTCAVQNGALKCWGLNVSGQLGDNTTVNRAAPVQVAGLASGVSSTATGDYHTCAIQNGALKCWGYGEYGQLGDDTTAIERTTPTQVTGMTSNVSDVSAGLYHTCAIQSGALKCWGYSGHGQLGYPISYPEPRVIAVP